MRHQLPKKMVKSKPQSAGRFISPTIDPIFRERVYHIIEFAAVPINISPSHPPLYARCSPFWLDVPFIRSVLDYGELFTIPFAMTCPSKPKTIGTVTSSRLTQDVSSAASYVVTTFATTQVSISALASSHTHSLQRGSLGVTSSIPTPTRKLNCETRYHCCPKEIPHPLACFLSRVLHRHSGS